jgi:hypothetical protein
VGFRQSARHSPGRRFVSGGTGENPQAEQVAEKEVCFFIPIEARNLSLIETQEKRDPSARSVPRNDKNAVFFAACEACATCKPSELFDFESLVDLDLVAGRQAVGFIGHAHDGHEFVEHFAGHAFALGRSGV